MTQFVGHWRDGNRGGRRRKRFRRAPVYHQPPAVRPNAGQRTEQGSTEEPAMQAATDDGPLTFQISAELKKLYIDSGPGRSVCMSDLDATGHMATK